MQIIRSKTKQMLIDKNVVTVPENKPVIIFHFTDLDEQAIPDLEIVDWSLRVLNTVNDDYKNGVKEHHIFCSNSFAFDRLRLLFKQGHFSNLLLEENNFIYDVVLPNGKMIGSDLPKESQLGKVHQDIICQNIVWSF